MRPFVRIGVVASLVALWAVGLATAEEGLTRRDRQGPVTGTVTLLAPPAAGTPVRAKVVLDTHSVALDAVALDQAVALRIDGGDVAPTSVEQATGSGHHREAVLVFAPLAEPGSVRIVVKNVGGAVERSFAWELPTAR